MTTLMKYLVIATLGFMALEPVYATPDVDVSTLHDELLKEIERSHLKQSDLGVLIVDEEGEHERTVLDLNSTKKMTPASLTKIMTAGAVLHTFTPNAQFKTQLLSDAKVANGSLQGSLYLKGGGDPSFVSETMWVLVNEFARNDIHTIEGDIVVDDSRFDDERFDESREDKRVDRAYDAPLGAMSFNWNSVNVYVRPGGKPEAPAIVKIDPPNSYIHLINKAKTGGKGHSIAVSRTAVKDGDEIMVTGKIAADANEVVVYKSITQPALWSGANLIEFLRQRDIHVKGHVRRGLAPAASRVMATAPSKPIAYIVADMAKFSNNYVAEMLTKNMAAETTHGQGNMKDGMEVIRKFMDHVGIQRAQYTLLNPSGFSLENEMSAQDMRKVLDHLRREFTVFPEFLAALPIAGLDGTLKSRMKGDGEQWVRAKSGSLTGVVGLAGFAARPTGSSFSFVMMYNGPADGGTVRALFDHMAGRLTR
jgi:D-alanyl-D-alanine carboxypeptidase/D-alanyl-D-alanine-endopeptidase (penicillin-binding protein 4)